MDAIPERLNGLPLSDLQQANAEKRLEAFIEALPAAVFVTDGQGKPCYSNSLSRTLLGRGIAGQKSEELAEVYQAYLAGTDLHYPSENMPIVRALHGISSSVDDMEIQRAEGRIAIEVHGAPLLNPDGKVAYAIALFKDITARKQMEKQLMISARLASIGMLAAGVAHEINNPLSYVVSNLAFAVEELRQHAPAQEEAIRALEEARGGAERVRVIVRDLKLLARQDEEKTGPVDVKKVLETSINMAWSEIKQSAKLVKVLDPVPMVMASEGRLGQIFLNLLVNAAHAIPQGAPDRNEIRVTTRTDGRGWGIIDVSDSGSGISREALPRIFSPFFTTKSARGGTGLGLAICHGIVTRLGGELTVETEIGRGTRFRVALPPAELQGPGPTTAVVARAGPDPSFKVLVVDDEPMIGEAVKRTLGQHQVVVVTDARVALQRVQAGEHFDIILSDLLMPEMSGMQLYAELKRMGSAHADRMVFFSGGLFSENSQSFLDGVSNLRLEKPFDPQALRTLIVRSCEASARAS